MVLAIIGSRTFDDYKLLDEVICNYFCDYVDNNIIIGFVPKFNKFVSGGAIGADSLGKKWVDSYNNELTTRAMKIEEMHKLIKVKEFLPDWKTYGKSAGFIRNEKIIKAADVVLSFWDGSSNGTRHSLGLAKKYKKPSFVVYF